MREQIRDKERLKHILDTCDILLSNKDLCSHEEIEADPIRYFGFVKHVEIIGEAVYMLSTELKEAHSEVEWDVIEAMRHVLVHGYYKIRPVQLWRFNRILHLYSYKILRLNNILKHKLFLSLPSQILIYAKDILYWRNRLRHHFP